jgi:hypothetical protein
MVAVAPGEAEAARAEEKVVKASTRGDPMEARVVRRACRGGRAEADGQPAGGGAEDGRGAARTERAPSISEERAAGVERRWMMKASSSSSSMPQSLLASARGWGRHATRGEASTAGKMASPSACWRAS